jgi:hypothetical protein
MHDFRLCAEGDFLPFLHLEAAIKSAPGKNRRFRQSCPDPILPIARLAARFTVSSLLFPSFGRLALLQSPRTRLKALRIFCREIPDRASGEQYKEPHQWQSSMTAPKL